ncbi:TetR/AcrR family transcriptional regulator [Terrisporobacter petrolearius]|uniref:TetR/AcrR family transcriptional regulator n=1 Tax=Terrisporobacter petrolearius TaxID=1460447 RepID=UPI001D161C81|nr:TetR/AcrR family transcriptional regulator [Terrisporobacter petrolearius]MCC3863600.1 TetR/AcrR family transcriptional regulator [Terrisporobacter petrolearius]
MSKWINYIIEEGNKENKLTKKQENILVAAVELISEKGYEKVSTAEIAKRAGVAEGTIFRQYKTKKDLLDAIFIPSFIRFVKPKIIKEFISSVLDKDYSTLESFVEVIVRDRYEFAKDETPLFRIIIQEIISQDYIKEEIKEIFLVDAYPVFTKLTKRLKDKNEITDVDEITFFRIIITNILGFLIPRFVLFPDLQWNDEKEINMVIQNIIKSLT